MSNLSAFPYIPEGAEAVPALWNTVYSVLSSNIASLATVVDLGHFQQLSIGSTPPSYATTAAVTIEVNSTQSDYLYMVDSSGARSSYIIGSRAGGTADGLNIWDVSGATMIVSFSKQSIRFYQNVTGPVFDVGGALANTLNAATFGTGADSKESRIQAAISAATTSNISRVYIPANMYPYSAASIVFSTAVQMTREGGNDGVYDVRAYGAFGDDNHDDTAAFRAPLSIKSVIVTVPFGTYKITSALTLLAGTTLKGDGGFVSIIKQYGNVDGLYAGAVTNMVVQDIQFFDGLGIASRTTGHGIHFDGTSNFVQYVIDRAYIVGFSNGVNAQRGGYSTIRDTRVVSPKEDGFNFGTLSTVNQLLDNCQAVAAGRFGYNLVNTNYTVINGGISDSAASHGYVLNAAFNTTINSTSAELNAGHGYLLLDSQKVVMNSINASRISTRDGIRVDGSRHVTILSPQVDTVSGWGVNGLNTYTNVIVLNHHITGAALGEVNDPSNTMMHYSANSLMMHGGPIVVGTDPTGSELVRAASGRFTTLAGTLSTANQPSITSLGVLTVLAVSGGVGPVQLTSSSAYFTGAPTNGTRFNNNADTINVLILSNDGRVQVPTGPLVVTASGVSGVMLVPAGTALIPTMAISSESSLGWYRSATSTLAVSYGTIDLTGSGAMTSIASLKIKSGTNNSCGTVVLGSNGSANVANTYVKTGDLIFLTDQTPGGTLGDLEIGGIRNSSGFTVQSTSITDTSTVGWLIIRPG